MNLRIGVVQLSPKVNMDSVLNTLDIGLLIDIVH